MNVSMLVKRSLAVAVLAAGIGLAAASPASAGWQYAGLADDLGQCETDGEMGILYGEWLDYYCEGPVFHGMYYRLYALYP